MDENEVRSIVQQMLQGSQYNVAKVASHIHNGTDSGRVSFRNIDYSFFITATNTTAGTLATVFNQFNSPINPTITGVFLIANDTTAGNISVYNSGKTVATLVKGTTAGAMVGATSLANTTGATLVTMKSDSAGNARVFITFST